MTVEATHEHVVKHAQIADQSARLRDQRRSLRVATVDRRLAHAGPREAAIFSLLVLVVPRLLWRLGNPVAPAILAQPQSSLVAAATSSIGAYCSFDAGMNLLRAK